MSSNSISLAGISKTYASASGEVKAVGDVTLDIQPGEFVSIVGPSGCGKSTLLNMLAGFMRPSGGSITVNGRPVGGNVPEGLGYIFQKDTVLPWYTVRKNIGLGLRFRGETQQRIHERVEELLTLGRLERFGDSYPHQLSGGMRRRLALLMSLACDPEILLLDEPFGALDTHTKTYLHKEMMEIWAREKLTAILVTHDLDEAVTLSTRVIVLSSPPSRVILDERIDIPFPRDVFTVRQTPEFAHHHSRIWSVLGQVFKSAGIDP